MALKELLVTPNRSVSVKVPLEMDDGQVWSFRVTGCSTTMPGPYKGRSHYAANVDLDEVRPLASLMAWKATLARLPYGGAKGGITVDAKGLSCGELGRLTRRFVNWIYDFIGPQTDIPCQK